MGIWYIIAGLYYAKQDRHLSHVNSQSQPVESPQPQPQPQSQSQPTHGFSQSAGVGWTPGLGPA